ncbi:MAG: hypothetical protein WEA09_01540 [Gemmatimonadota bacterium]
MGIFILAIVVLLVFDLLDPDSVLERILIPSASPPGTPVERVLDRLPERLPFRIR